MAPAMEARALLRGHDERCWHVAWSPCGRLVASCSSDRTIRVWQEAGAAETTWVEVARLEDAHDRTVRACEWSPCGSMVAGTSFDGTCCVWRRADEGTDNLHLDFDLVATLEGHENEVKACAWSASGSVLATCGRDKTVWLWEAEETAAASFELITVCHGHDADVKSVAFDPLGDRFGHGDLLVSASYDCTLKVWGDDGDDWSCRATLDAHTSTVWCVAFERANKDDDVEGRRLVTCGDDRSVLVWRETSRDGTEWALFARVDEAHTRPIYAVDWRHGLIATAAGDNALALYRLEADAAPPSTALRLTAVARVPQAHGADLNSVRWHPSDPTQLATAADDCLVKIWKTTTTFTAASS